MTLKKWWAKNKAIIEKRVAVKVKAAETAGLCRYRVDRNPENTTPENCCFIGVTLTPETYRLRFDIGRGMMASQALPIAEGLVLSYFEMSLLDDLQIIHDLHLPEEWDQMFIDWRRNHAGTLGE